MKIYSVYFYTLAGDSMKLVDNQSDFSDIGFMHRKYAAEICNFAAFEMANGKNMNTCITAQEQGYLISMFRPNKNSAAVIATNKDYPSRAAFSILREISNEYEQSGNSFIGGKSQVMKKAITDYQNPANADKILKIQENLAEAQKIMVMNLEQAIARQESLSELAQKSDRLSETSQLFLRDTKKLNKCCSIL